MLVILEQLGSEQGREYQPEVFLEKFTRSRQVSPTPVDAILLLRRWTVLIKQWIQGASLLLSATALTSLAPPTFVACPPVNLLLVILFAAFGICGDGLGDVLQEVLVELLGEYF